MHTSTREKCDSSGIDVPTEGVGNVARLLVLREQADERPPDLTVKRCENERERRLRDTRVRREVVRERAKALTRGESVDEAGEW
jgi:hypothetical protein